VRALCILLPGFESYFAARRFALVAADDALKEGRNLAPGTRPVDADTLTMGLGRKPVLHVVPAGALGGTEIVLLIGALVVTAALTIVTLMSMPRAQKAAEREDATKTDSYLFDGAQNRTEQGHPLALAYGRVRVGSIVGSAGISTTDIGTDYLTQDTGYVGQLPGIAGAVFGDEWYAMHLAKGGKGGSGSARAAQEDPNNLQSQATAKIVDMVGEGEIRGLVNGLKSISFDDTPLQNPDDSFNFAGVAIEQRVGLPDQDPMPGFSQSEASEDINTQVKVLTGPVTRTVSDEDVDVARVTIRLPQLYQQDTTNGDMKRSSVQIRILLQSNGGGFTEVVNHTFNGKNTAPYQRSFDVRLPKGGAPHDIRVERVTPDSDLASVANETWWDLLTEIIEAKLIYPNTAMFGLTVDARQFGSNIPTRSYDIYGLIVDVPTNYDPDTRTYTGVWDGTFKRAWTDNPAWVTYDVVSSKRYGLGRRVPEWARDKWALYAIGQRCDGLVPDFQGGTQPRHTFNGVIDSPAAAYDIIASLASTFRGWSYWGSSRITFAQDAPEDPSVLVTPANAVDGEFIYDRVTPLDQRRSVAVVYWNDPNDGGRLTPEVVEDQDLIRRIGWEPGDEVTAFACNNRGEAHRHGLWLLEDQSQPSNASVEYQAGQDHAFAAPGRIATVADPMYAAERRGGRVKAATANTLTMDAPFTLEAGVTYTLNVVLPDGQTSVRPVTNAAGQVTVLNLGGGAWATPPIVNAVWQLESSEIANRQFRIKKITADKPPYKVRGILHDPTKYDRVEQDRDIAVPNYLGGVPTGPLTPPQDLAILEFLYQDGNAAIPCVQVSWVGSPDPRVAFYQAQFRRPGGRFEAFADSIDTAREVRGAEPGSWEFRVRALDTLGRKTGWVGKTYMLGGQQSAPPNVTGLSLVSDDDALTAALKWTPPNDTRPLRFEVLYHATVNDVTVAATLGLTDAREYPVTAAGHYWVRTQFMDSKATSQSGRARRGGPPPCPHWTRWPAPA